VLGARRRLARCASSKGAPHSRDESLSAFTPDIAFSAAQLIELLTLDVKVSIGVVVITFLATQAAGFISDPN